MIAAPPGLRAGIGSRRPCSSAAAGAAVIVGTAATGSRPAMRDPTAVLLLVGWLVAELIRAAAWLAYDHHPSRRRS
jgi:hypothetical protein